MSCGCGKNTVVQSVEEVRRQAEQTTYGTVSAGVEPTTTQGQTTKKS